MALISEAALPVNPADDWISRTELAQLLGISRQTAHRHAQKGLLRCFEHGSPVVGKQRRYSRYLVERHLHSHLQHAMGRSPIQ